MKAKLSSLDPAKAVHISLGHPMCCFTSKRFISFYGSSLLFLHFLGNGNAVLLVVPSTKRNTFPSYLVQAESKLKTISLTTFNSLI